MRDEQSTRTVVAVELSRRLDEGRARAGLNQTQLARQAGLGRTTVSEALSSRGPVPSTDTVSALAHVLKLPLDELLKLQRDAKNAEDPDAATAPAVPGRPIGQWEPHELEVHPAGHGSDASSSPDAPGVRALPGYVPRGHDRMLADAVRDAAAGRSRIVVLVGTSSTGKTRACWEAVQPLAKIGWRLWHPFDPTRAEAALAELGRVGPQTVVWLNEAQHYLGGAAGERIAAAVHRLLVDEERGPVLVLGTLWPEYAHQFALLPEPVGTDPHSRVRELLAGRTHPVLDAFDADALTRAAALAEQGDRLLADALTRARDGGRVTQDLAGAPELLRRYEQATPPARALLDAAMDARRLGVGLHLPQAFLTDAAPDYLSQDDYDQLTDNWAELAYAELAEPVHGKQAPLRRTMLRPPRRPPAPSAGANTPASLSAGPIVRLADYLEQHGRTTRRQHCPPASFWHAAHSHLTHTEDLCTLAQAAEERHRLQWAYHLRHRAVDHGDVSALGRLAVAQEEAGDQEGAEALAWRAADHGDTSALVHLAELREQAEDQEGAEVLARKAADYGNTYALGRLARLRDRAGDRNDAESLLQQAADCHDAHAATQLTTRRERTGDREGAEALARRAADHGDTSALTRLAELREQAGDREGAETLARHAAALGDTSTLARLWEKAGDRKGAEALARRAADHGDTSVMVQLAELREQAGDQEGAENLAWHAADLGDPYGLAHVAELREKAGDKEGAEALARRAADHADPFALTRLARVRENAGDWAGAESLTRRAADLGDTYALVQLVRLREEAGDRKGAEALARHAAALSDTSGLVQLAELREQAGDQEGAENLAWHAADLGDTSGLVQLAELREEAGDREGAENLAQHAADYGRYVYASRLHQPLKDVLFRLWPDGLEPDGMPMPPWKPLASDSLC
ncbi:helix-turn-helix domain-containing protein [Streptomyces sp. NPDC000963]